MKPTNNRARIVVVIAICVVAAVAGCSPKAQKSTSQGGQLTVVSWGGDLQNAERDAFFTPFGKAHNATVTDQPYTGEYAKIKAQVDSGSVDWDVIEVEEPQVTLMGSQGLLEPIDYSVVPRDSYLTNLTDEYGVGTLVASTMLCWNTKRIPAGTPPPSSWKDLWDTKRYPGKRGLYKDPASTLEIALLADGVSPKNLYPLDVDRALRKLSQIKSSIVWWSGGSEFQQKMLSDYTVACGWNGRVWDLEHQKQPVSGSFNQGILTTDWWIVPRGTKHRQLAMQFLASAAQSDGQRTLAERMAYGPVSKDAAGTLPSDIQASIPTSPTNLKQEIWLNAKWWAANDKQVREKWNTWLLQ